MKGLAELIAENAALVARARKREADSIRRLKQRIASIVWRMPREHRAIRKAIDAWHAAERKRGLR